MKFFLRSRVLGWLLSGYAGLLFTSDLIGAETKTADPKKSATSEKLPSVEEVISRFLKAVGGREAILKHSSFQAKGTFEMPAQGLKGNLEIFSAKPNKNVLRVEIPNFGRIAQGFDGKVGWSIDPAMGGTLLSGKQLQQARDQAEFYNVLHEEKSYKSMEVVGSSTFEGKECYKLKLVRESGEEVTEYFDKKTGLQAGSTASQHTPFGEIPVTIVLSDYKQFGGVLTPGKLTQKVVGMEQVITISSIEYDKVSPSAFELPKEIKALAAP